MACIQRRKFQAKARRKELPHVWIRQQAVPVLHEFGLYGQRRIVILRSPHP